MTGLLLQANVYEGRHCGATTCFTGFLTSMRPTAWEKAGEIIDSKGSRRQSSGKAWKTKAVRMWKTEKKKDSQLKMATRMCWFLLVPQQCGTYSPKVQSFSQFHRDIPRLIIFSVSHRFFKIRNKEENTDGRAKLKTKVENDGNGLVFDVCIAHSCEIYHLKFSKHAGLVESIRKAEVVQFWGLVINHHI